MLTLARIEAVTTEGHRAAAVFVSDMVTVVRRNAEQLSSIAEINGVGMMVTSPGSILTTIEESDLDLLCSNLMLNAIQHSPKGATLRATAELMDDKVELRIVDEGTGIDPELLPYVFDRFYRSDPSRSRRTGGTGLGLAICKAIVERAQGTITITSKLGSGTTVWVRLPVGSRTLSVR